MRRRAQLKRRVLVDKSSMYASIHCIEDVEEFGNQSTMIPMISLCTVSYLKTALWDAHLLSMSSR